MFKLEQIILLALNLKHHNHTESNFYAHGFPRALTNCLQRSASSTTETHLASWWKAAVYHHREAPTSSRVKSNTEITLKQTGLFVSERQFFKLDRNKWLRWHQASLRKMRALCFAGRSIERFFLIMKPMVL